MNKAYSYEDLKNNNFSSAKNTEFHQASASTERFSSLIFKTTDSDFQKIEPELDKYTLAINYSTNLRNFTVDGDRITTADGHYYVNDVTNQSTVNISMDENWFVTGHSNCDVSQINGYAGDTLSVFNMRGSCSITIIFDDTVNYMISVIKGKMLFDGELTPYTRWTYENTISGSPAIRFKVIPDDGYELNLTPVISGDVPYEMLDKQGYYYIDFSKATATTVAIQFTCTEKEPDTPPITDIPINVAFSSGALSSLRINGVSIDTSGTTASGTVKSNATSFVIYYTLASNYSLTNVKVNGTGLSSGSFTATRATITMSGGVSAYNIELVTLYTAPVVNREVIFSNANVATVTMKNPAVDLNTRSISSGVFWVAQFPNDITTCSFEVAINDETKYELVNVVADNGNLSYSNTSKRYTLSNIFKESVNVNVQVKLKEPEKPKYTFRINYDDSYSDKFEDYFYTFNLADLLKTFNSNIVTDSDTAFIVFNLKSRYTGQYKVDFSASNGEVVKDESDDTFTCGVTAKSSDTPVVITVTVTPVESAKYYVTISRPSGSSIISTVPNVASWNSGEKKAFVYDDFAMGGLHIINLTYTKSNSANQVTCTVNGINCTYESDDTQCNINYEVSESVHEYNIVFAETAPPVTNDDYTITLSRITGSSFNSEIPAVSTMWTRNDSKTFKFGDLYNSKSGNYELVFEYSPNNTGNYPICKINGTSINYTANNGNMFYKYVYPINQDIHTYAIVITESETEPEKPPTPTNYTVEISANSVVKQEISLAIFNGINCTDDIKTNGEKTIEIPLSTSSVAYSITVTDAFDISALLINDNPVTDFTRDGRNISGTVNLSQYGNDISFVISASKTLSDLTFADNGTNEKWTSTINGGATYYASSKTMIASKQTISSSANPNISYGIGFNIPSKSNIRYLKLAFDKNHHYPSSESKFYIKASNTLITADELVASVSGSGFSWSPYKATATNDYVEVESRNLYLNASAGTVTIDLSQIADIATYKYIYVGFVWFTHTGSNEQKIYIKSYQYRKDVSGLTVGTASATSPASTGFFDGSVIIDGTVIQECDPTGESIPYNSYSFTITDENNEYSPLSGSKTNAFTKYQPFLIYGVVKDYEQKDGVSVSDGDESLYITQIARCRFNGIEHNNGIATFNFIGTLEYYDNIYMTDDEKQKYCSHTNGIKVSTFLENMFGSDVNLNRIDNSGLKVFSDKDTIIIPFEDESKTEIVRTIAQAFGMFIFEDNDGKIRFHTNGDYFDATESAPFKLELEQSFSNPNVIAKDEAVDSIDLTYHTFVNNKHEEVNYSSVDYFYHKYTGDSSFDCRNNKDYVLYYTTSNDNTGYMDENKNLILENSVNFNTDLAIDFIKIRFNFDRIYSVNSLRFFTDESIIFPLNDHVRDGYGSRLYYNLNINELAGLFLDCWCNDEAGTTPVQKFVYDMLPETNPLFSKKNHPYVIVTEKYVDFIFNNNDSNNNCNYYRSPFVEVMYDENNNGTFDPGDERALKLTEASTIDWIQIWSFDAFMLMSNTKGKPIEDLSSVYHLVPYGTKNKTVAVDNPLIDNIDNAMYISQKLLQMNENCLYEVNNDWKGDCTIAVGDNILNSIPISTDLNDLSKKTYKNYKSALVKYNNYSIENGLTCNTKTAMPKGLFYGLEGKTNGVTTKVNDFTFSATNNSFKV